MTGWNCRMFLRTKRVWQVLLKAMTWQLNLWFLHIVILVLVPMFCVRNLWHAFWMCCFKCSHYNASISVLKYAILLHYLNIRETLMRKVGKCDKMVKDLTSCETHENKGKPLVHPGSETLPGKLHRSAVKWKRKNEEIKKKQRQPEAFYLYMFQIIYIYI